jgi:phosphatidylglycerophosphatase A
VRSPMTNAKSIWDHGALLLGQWFGTGLSPKAPGTVGSLGTLPLFFLLKDVPWPAYWAVTLVVSGGGIIVSERCAKLLGEKDPSSVVIDEVAGVMIALGIVRHAPLWVLGVAWLLFRLLDITKPGLIDKAQHWPPYGVGIMADDILAGIVAGVLSLGIFQAFLALT